MGWEATPKMPSQVIIYSMGWEAIHHTSNALTSHTYLPRTTAETSLTNLTDTAQTASHVCHSPAPGRLYKSVIHHMDCKPCLPLTHTRKTTHTSHTMDSHIFHLKHHEHVTYSTG